MKSAEPQQESIVRRIAEEKAAEPGARLPILHSFQDELGYVPQTAVPIVAGVLNLSWAEVHGEITFYHLVAARAVEKLVMPTSGF